MSHYIPVDLRRQVRQRFHDRCAYCQTSESLTVAIFEIDHITPRSASGATVIENLCLACPTCNRYKSDRSAGLSSSALTESRLFHPQLDSWSDHFRWNDDATQLVGLTALSGNRKGDISMPLSRKDRSYSK